MPSPFCHAQPFLSCPALSVMPGPFCHARPFLSYPALSVMPGPFCHARPFLSYPALSVMPGPFCHARPFLSCPALSVMPGPFCHARLRPGIHPFMSYPANVEGCPCGRMHIPVGGCPCGRMLAMAMNPYSRAGARSHTYLSYPVRPGIPMASQRGALKISPSNFDRRKKSATCVAL